MATPQTQPARLRRYNLSIRENDPKLAEEVRDLGYEVRCRQRKTRIVSAERRRLLGQNCIELARGNSPLTRTTRSVAVQGECGKVMRLLSVAPALSFIVGTTYEGQ